MQRQFPGLKKAILDAMYQHSLELWQDAFKKAKDFRKSLKPKLAKGDRAAQAINRDKVIPLGT